MEYNLQNAILTLYDYYYKKNLREDFKVIDLKANDIKLEDIKILSVPKEFLKEFKEGKFKIESSREGLITLKRFGNSFPTSVKISFYKNKKEIEDLYHPNNRDSYFSLLFSGKVLENKLSMIKLPVFNFDVKYSEIEDIINTYPENDEILKLIDTEKIIDTVSVRVREHFQNYQKLSRYLETNKVNFSELIFQVLICLEMLNQEYPSFNHNKLDLDAIEILEEENDEEYIIEKETYHYPSKIKIKISNFEKGSLGKITSKNITNRFSDLFYLCFHLEKNKNIVFDKLGKEIFNEIKKISIKNNNGYMLEKIEPTTPSKLLKKHFTNKRSIKNKETDNKEFKGLRNLKEKYFKIKGNLPSALGNQDEFTDTENKETKLKRRINKKKQKGGSGVVKPNFTKKAGDNMTNDQRMSYKKLSMDKPRSQEPALLAEQKVYQTSKAPPKTTTQPNMYPPAFVPVNTPYSSVPIPLPYEFKPNNIPIQNIYNLNIADPRGDHSVLARVYEDMVPGNEFGLSSISVDQRLKSSDYIKNIMLKSKEGEDMSLTGGKDSILEHVQMHDLNPYHYRNPQKELANGFMLYSSAYPIRYDASKQQIKLGKNSTGVNIRIYRLSHDELASHFNGHMDKLNYNVWRELAYYQKINQIMKEQKVPSFVKMHFWVLDRQSNIKWDQLENIKYQGIELKQLQELVNGRKKTIPKIEELREQLFKKYITNDALRKVIEAEVNKGITDQTWIDLKDKYEATFPAFKDITSSENPIRKTIIALSQELPEHLLKDSKVSLGIITESPQQTFINWATPIYQGTGSLKTMIQTGYHEPNVWTSLLFQYIYGLSVLQKNNIHMVNFEPKYNLLVKNIYHDERDTKHWRYNVDGLTFFIPNNGYVGLIDSYYNQQSDDDKKKIQMDGLKDDNNNIYDINQIKNNVFEYMFKKVIDRDFYGPSGEWRELGGLPAPDEFLLLLDKLNSKIPEYGSNIKLYLNEFTMFLHNRAGDRVDSTEIDNLDLSRVPSNITRNKVMIKRDYKDYIYKFVVVLGKDLTNKISYINKYLVWDGEKVDSISSAQLFEPHDLVEPKYEKGVKLDKESVLENYNL